jgi:hypothetical protein
VFKDSVAEWQGEPVSARWLSAEAARIRKQAESLATEQDKKDARELAARMDFVADPALAGQIPDEYREVPRTKRYGRLGGMWVRKEIYDDMIGVASMTLGSPSFAQRLLGDQGGLAKATAWWKMGKVALNPPSQIRNMVSNLVLLHLSGVPMWRILPTLIQAATEIHTNGANWEIAQRYGVTKASFAANELIDIRNDLLDLQARSGKYGQWGHLLRIAGIIGKRSSTDRSRSYEDVGVLTDLLGNQAFDMDTDDAITPVLQSRPGTAIGFGLVGLIMLRAIEEDTGTGNAAAVVVKIGLNGYHVGRSVLGMIREPDAVLVKVIQELSFEAGRGVNPLAQPVIVLVVGSLVVCLVRPGMRQGP